MQNNFNPKFNFSVLKSYQIIYKTDKKSTLVNTRIEHAIYQELAQKGFHKIETNSTTQVADFYVVFYTQIKEKSNIFANKEHLSPYKVSTHYVPSTEIVKNKKISLNFQGKKTAKESEQTATSYNLQYLDTPAKKMKYVHEAKLFIDLVDTKTYKLFWQGIATDYLRDFETPSEKEEYISTMVKVLLKTFNERSIQKNKL